MRQDKTFARIFFVIFVVNLALAAPAVVRQRHLDVAKAASEKRAQDPEIGSTDSPGTGPSRMPPHEHYTHMWGWANGDHLESLSSGSGSSWETSNSPPTSFHSSVNWPDPSPPPHLLATQAATRPTPEAEDFLSKHGAVGYMGMVGILGSAIAFGYALNQGVKKMYVFPLPPLSCGHLTESQSI